MHNYDASEVCLDTSAASRRMRRDECPGSHLGPMNAGEPMYAGQDRFFDEEPPFCAAIADAMAFFIARYVPVRLPVTTA